MKNNIEKRFITDIHIDKRNIKGTAIVFNKKSELMYSYELDKNFREIILPEAVDESLIKKSDIFMLYNHSGDKGVLARSNKGNGTLKISVDDNGVHYDFEAPKTTLGEDLLESISRGDISSSSFAFTIKKGGDKWENKDGEFIRYITKIEMLYDFSIVNTPAYKDTSVDVRYIITNEKNNNNDMINKRENEKPVDEVDEVNETDEVNVEDKLKEIEEKINQLINKVSEIEKKLEESDKEDVKEDVKEDDKEDVKEENKRKLDEYYSTYKNIIIELKK
jgi:hypothetical protein